MISHRFSTKFSDIACDDVIGAFQRLSLFLEPCFRLQLFHVGSIQNTETASLLQVGDQDCLGLATQAVVTIGEYTAHVA